MTDLARGTEAYLESVAYVFYGISRDTFDVQAIRYTRGHDLILSNRDGSTTRHHVDRRQIAETEVRATYGLTDVMMIPVALADASHAGIARLREKAADMQARRDGETAEDA